MVTTKDIYTAISEFREEFVCARDMHVVLYTTDLPDECYATALNSDGRIFLNLKKNVGVETIGINEIKSTLLHEDLGHLAINNFITTQYRKEHLFLRIYQHTKFLETKDILSASYQCSKSFLENINNEYHHAHLEFKLIREYIAHWFENYLATNPSYPKYSMIEKIKRQIFPLEDIHEFLIDMYWKYKTTYVKRPKHWIKGGIQEKHIDTAEID